MPKHDEKPAIHKDYRKEEVPIVRNRLNVRQWPLCRLSKAYFSTRELEDHRAKPVCNHIKLPSGKFFHQDSFDVINHQYDH